jgi:hypothetical protein
MLACNYQNPDVYFKRSFDLLSTPVRACSEVAERNSTLVTFSETQSLQDDLSIYHANVRPLETFNLPGGENAIMRMIISPLEHSLNL